MDAVPTSFEDGFDGDVVRSWILDDPDPATAAELSILLQDAESLVDEAPAALAELENRFSGLLSFGTAGLRGEIGAGPQRMNRAVVIRAAAGISAWLGERVGPGFRVVIGCDARHGSADFARDTAAVVTAAGGEALLLPAQRPTPLLAFAVRHLDADAGVMVTASHNPPRDNGYKVYLGGRAVTDAGQGAQLVAPMDAEIAALIDAVPSVASVPRRTQGIVQLGEEIEQAYLARIADLVPARERHLRIVHTSLHGVGGDTCLKALAGAGFEDVHPVPQQADPDPDFPTVAFPNPEEDGALDLAIAHAEHLRANLIIANDPDADRLSVAVPTDAGWRQLTGDEVGLLLGDLVASRLPAAEAGQTAPVLAASLVSSRALGSIAVEHEIAFRATLTGFKWISRVPGLVFGYEEALGYCCDPAFVRDKDGISAAVLLAELAAELQGSGGLLHRLDQLALRHGVRLTAPLSFRVADLSLIAEAMERLRAQPPAELAGSPVTVTDLSEGSAQLPPTDGIVLLSERGDRAVIRPSGTEPKLKCYLEAVEAPDEDLAGARDRASGRLSRIKAELRTTLGL